MLRGPVYSERLGSQRGTIAARTPNVLRARRDSHAMSHVNRIVRGVDGLILPLAKVGSVSSRLGSVPHYLPESDIRFLERETQFLEHDTRFLE